MRREIDVRAKDVQEGDMISGLDDAFVVEDPEPDPDFRDRYNMGLAHGKVCITFHDAEGEEGYLLCQPDMEMVVRRADA